MSKFRKPQPPDLAAVEAVIEGAVTDGARARAAGPDDAAKEVRFTMTLPADMAAAVDRERRRLGLSRLGWIRMVLAERLDRASR